MSWQYKAIIMVSILIVITLGISLVLVAGNVETKEVVTCIKVQMIYKTYKDGRKTTGLLCVDGKPENIEQKDGVTKYE